MPSSRVRTLVNQSGRGGRHRYPHHAERDASVEWRRGHEFQRPLHRESEETKANVDDLQVRHRVDQDVEIIGEEVPENLGPEETLDTSANLN